MPYGETTISRTTTSDSQCCCCCCCYGRARQLPENDGSTDERETNGNGVVMGERANLSSKNDAAAASINDDFLIHTRHYVTAPYSRHFMRYLFHISLFPCICIYRKSICLAMVVYLARKTIYKIRPSISIRSQQRHLYRVLFTL